ncbi:MAG: C69 family dipeptidase [Acidobacteriota bacterium]|nr:C69 family dipeptidase [Acidobacteriota bacterium]
MNLKRPLTLICILLAIGILFGTTSLLTKEELCVESIDKEYMFDGCTSVLVGKNASIDGSTMTTHTCDCGICDWTWRHVPAADYKPEEMRKIYHISQYITKPPEKGLKWDTYTENYAGVEIPQVANTYAYHHGMFGYMNEHQLAIGESTIGCRRKMRNPTPSATFDITTLTLVAMERCKTAREAIKLMGTLGEKYGYGFYDHGEMLAVADPDEVWIFEIMPVGPLWTQKSGKPGAIWCAQRVPDDHVSVCPNESRIGEIDLNNPDYFMASPNVISYAIENEYYDPKSGEPFNWKKAYSPTEASAASSGGSRARLWRFFDLVAPSRNFSPETPNMDFPFSVKPDKKLSIQDVINITRDKYQGTPFDTGAGLIGGPFSNPNYRPRPLKVDDETYNTPRSIGVNAVEYTTITQCRGWLPDPIGGIVWIAFGAQDTSCYMPFYAGVTELPASFAVGDHWVLNRQSARWAFDYVDFHTLVAYSYAIKDVQEAQEKWEASAINRRPLIDKIATELYQKDSSKAAQFLTDYCMNNANQVVEAWWNLGDNLLVKYNHLRIYDTKTRKSLNLSYPEWWMKEIVKYHKLKPQKKAEKTP